MSGSPSDSSSGVDRFLNELAQGLRPMDEGLSWFAECPVEERRALLRQLAAFVLQAHPRPREVKDGIAVSGLRLTHTPAVLIVKDHLSIQLRKIVNLPADEQVKAFRLMIAVLGVADGRRRQQEQEQGVGCSHWWHQLRG